MAINIETYKSIIAELNGRAQLVAVSKTKPVEDIRAFYDLGQRDFGENYVQELMEKEAVLPKDIRWHFIGHLQTNKVKYIAPFVYLVHGIDSPALLKEINKQGAKNNRVINCLLQVHIATEETKFGFEKDDLQKLDELHQFKNVNIAGLMGMASFSDDNNLVRKEFAYLNTLFISNTQLYTSAKSNVQQLDLNQPILSMGMSGDYKIAIEEGSNMVRIGSLLFGERNYNK